MTAPMVCFVTWNRLGLTIKNLKALLATTDDFELYIVDNMSSDGTWDYLRTVDDPRIVCKHQLDCNRGVVYAINYVLGKRKKDQYFILVENDVCIHTKDWITQFMNAMDAFPKVGLIGGARIGFFEEKNIDPSPIKKDNIVYYPYKKVLGCCNCIRPEVFDLIGYWNEETYAADRDMSIRINHHTPYHTGYITSIALTQEQHITCDCCSYKSVCPIVAKGETCFEHHRRHYVHGKFASLAAEYEERYLQEISSGKRSIYCASIHDKESMEKHVYHHAWAEANFDYYIKKANKSSDTIL